MTLTKKINISEIIELYDMQNRENSKHISSITGLIGEDLLSGLLKHYLCRNEDGVDVKIDESVTPKQKGKNGKMLDRWILTSKLGVADKCYQTEIKNWSSHSLSGVKFDFNPELPLDFDTNKSDEIFNKIWDKTYGGRLSLFVSDAIPYKQGLLICGSTSSDSSCTNYTNGKGAPVNNDFILFCNFIIFNTISSFKISINEIINSSESC